MASSVRLVDTAENHLLWLRPPIARSDDPVACSKWDLGGPAIREVVQDRAGGNGVVDLTAYYGARTFTASLMVRGNDDLGKEEILDLLRALANPRQRFYVYVQMPTWESERRLIVRPNPITCVIDKVAGAYYTIELSYSGYTGELEDTSQSYNSVRPAGGPSTGLSWPTTFPVTWTPANSSNVVSVYNSGNTEAPVIFVVSGRCSDPVITNYTTGEQFAMKNVDIASNQYLVIDTDKKEVLLNNEINLSYYSFIDWDAQTTWFKLAPEGPSVPDGRNDIRFAASNIDEGCLLESYYRPRWI